MLTSSVQFKYKSVSMRLVIQLIHSNLILMSRMQMNEGQHVSNVSGSTIVVYMPNSKNNIIELMKK